MASFWFVPHLNRLTACIDGREMHFTIGTRLHCGSYEITSLEMILDALIHDIKIRISENFSVSDDLVSIGKDMFIPRTALKDGATSNSLIYALKGMIDANKRLMPSMYPCIAVELRDGKVYIEHSYISDMELRDATVYFPYEKLDEMIGKIMHPDGKDIEYNGRSIPSAMRDKILTALRSAFPDNPHITVHIQESNDSIYSIYLLYDSKIHLLFDHPVELGIIKPLLGALRTPNKLTSSHGGYSVEYRTTSESAIIYHNVNVAIGCDAQSGVQSCGISIGSRAFEREGPEDLSNRVPRHLIPILIDRLEFLLKNTIKSRFNVTNIDIGTYHVHIEGSDIGPFQMDDLPLLVKALRKQGTVIVNNDAHMIYSKDTNKIHFWVLYSSGKPIRRLEGIVPPELAEELAAALEKAYNDAKPTVETKLILMKTTVGYHMHITDASIINPFVCECDREHFPTIIKALRNPGQTANGDSYSSNYCDKKEELRLCHWTGGNRFVNAAGTVPKSFASKMADQLENIYAENMTAQIGIIPATDNNNRDIGCYIRLTNPTIKDLFSNDVMFDRLPIMIKALRKVGHTFQDDKGGAIYTVDEMLTVYRKLSEKVTPANYTGRIPIDCAEVLAERLSRICKHKHTIIE